MLFLLAGGSKGAKELGYLRFDIFIDSLRIFRIVNYGAIVLDIDIDLYKITI